MGEDADVTGEAGVVVATEPVAEGATEGVVDVAVTEAGFDVTGTLETP